MLGAGYPPVLIFILPPGAFLVLGFLMALQKRISHAREAKTMISQDMNLFLIFLSAMIVNNILLIRFIALCSFFGISNNIQTSVGMGMAVLFVMVMASSISWVVYHFILVPFDLTYLRTASFILTIATFVQLEEMAIRKMFPALYRAMGIYLPLIVVNCAVLAAAFLIIDYNLDFIKSLDLHGRRGGRLLRLDRALRGHPRAHLARSRVAQLPGVPASPSSRRA